jgi:prephenate dehydrogenase
MSSSSSKITVGIIGFGAFGRLLANALFPHVNLCIRDRKHAVATLENGVEYPCASLQEIADCRYVVLAVPVSEIGRVSRDLAPLLGAGTTVVDVGSVKVAPTEAMRAALPAHVDIIGTHPLFGPQSAPAGLTGLKVAICPVRGTGHRRLAAFLKTAFRLRTILTTAEAHDREAATVQGLTHLIAKVMLEMEPLPTRLTTVSYDHLMQAIRMVKDDAPNVREAIERVNPYTMVVREEFFSKAAKVRAAFEP